MIGLRADSYRSRPGPLLRFAPPVLVSPTVITVTTDPATRDIRLGQFEDAIIYAPDPITFVPTSGQTEAIVQVFGGRNIRWVGADITADPGPLSCYLTAPMNGTDLVATVNSTDGFPWMGTVRIDGEQMRYGSKTATTFQIEADGRRYGYYNSSSLSSDQAHSAGAIVYRGEYARTPVAISNNRGQVHLEGHRYRGMPCDSVRVVGSYSTQVTTSNCRSDPSTNHDPIAQRDAHPDAMQVNVSSPAVVTIRQERCTWQGGRSGRGFLNSCDPGVLAKVIALDTEWKMSNYGVKALDNTADAAVVWECTNAWVRSDQYRRLDLLFNSAQVEPAVGWAPYDDGSPDFCPEGVAGVGYVSPGYL